eukprot:tig00000194_g14781.t1
MGNETSRETSEQSRGSEADAKNQTPAPSAPPYPAGGMYPPPPGKADYGDSMGKPYAGASAPPPGYAPMGAYAPAGPPPPGAPGVVGPPAVAYPVQAGPAMAMPMQMPAGTLGIVADGPVLSPAFVFNFPFRWVITDDLFSGRGAAATIKDASGQDILRGAGKWVSFHDDTTFYDMQGNKVCRLMNRILTGASTYKIINAQDKTVMVQRREILNWPGTWTSKVFRGNPHFNIFGNPEFPTAYPEIYRIKNAVTQATVATVNKSLFFNTADNATVLECAPGVDALLMLMIAIVVAHETRKKRGVWCG